MIFADNVLKEYLKNVYFITGTPCGGKTTVSKLLSRMYDIPLYDIDSMFDTHTALSDREHQPCMNAVFTDADEFFGRSMEEYLKYCAEMKERSTFQSEVNVTAEDRILGMSTCRYDVSDGRYVLFGRLVSIN